VKLTHTDDEGAARMVDVGGKETTERRAVARGVVQMSAETAKLVAQGGLPKGDVIGVARVAGIQAAKRTDELIPLCHSLPLSYANVEIEVGEDSVTIVAEARTTAQTGVEMEALTACSVAALTIYDMVKAVERPRIASIELVHKSGGRTNF
jgi:cyclic pyranopterin phosphate synthase